MTKFLLAVALVSSSATVLVSSAPAGAAIRLAPVLDGLDNPDFVTNARDGSHRLFVIEQPGVIRVFPLGASASVVFLDITARVLFGGERGLLGLAFHPQFSSNGRFFVDYTRKPDGATVIAEYRVSAADPSVAEGAETVLLVIPQPFANHNGGMIEFGPDGFLYIGMGDGGSGNDPGNRAQNVSDLLGKILRIDVDHPTGGLPYSVPADNPFVGAAAGRGEIFAYGLRNPFRFSFDRATGDLYAGDVGQGAVEEIDIVRNGGNYGWRVWEGSTCTGNDPGLCSAAGFEFPIAEYGHTGGRCAVIGGYVYRGAAATLPAGSYVYGDLCTGEIFLLENGSPRVLLDSGLSLSSFGEDEAGEIYAVGTGGSVVRLVNPCAPGAAGDPLCGSLRLSAGVSQPSFAPGETLSATIGFDNPGLADAADVYIGVLQPDQTVVTFTSEGPGTSGLVVNFATFAPLATGVGLTSPFATARPDFLVHQWVGSELRGQYTFFVLAVRAGAFADGEIAPDEILALATAPFSFQ
jgi:glucose/arabinose dehydrogenase